jgi:twitching motility two-component system response regulator PilG
MDASPQKSSAGSMAAITRPLGESSQPPDSATPHVAVTGAGARGLRVLFVDDSRSTRQSAETLLKQNGFITSLASDGFEALCRLTEMQPDIILMDGMMPRLDGFQTCALIRRHSRYRDLPVIILSGGDSLLDRVRAELAGAQRYLLKPFSRQELVQAIHELLPAVSSAVSQPAEGGAAAGQSAGEITRVAAADH